MFVESNKDPKPVLCPAFFSVGDSQGHEGGSCLQSPTPSQGQGLQETEAVRDGEMSPVPLGFWTLLGCRLPRGFGAIKPVVVAFLSSFGSFFTISQSFSIFIILFFNFRGVFLPSETHLPLEPCYSKCDLRTSSISTPGNVLEMQTFRPQPRSGQSNSPA